MFDDDGESQGAFLEATWSDICMLTFAVDPALLVDRVPSPLELETRGGEAFVSLVALDFAETSVWGVGWPGFRSFPEVNFRFYVRHGERRGVMFLRQFVPQPFVAWMAGLFYREPFQATPMESDLQVQGGVRKIEHRWSYGGQRHRLHLEAGDEAEAPDTSSDAHRFLDRHWGFAAGRTGGALTFQLEHADWKTYPVRSFDLEIDWSSLYGREWDALVGEEPVSVVMADGSSVELYSREPVE